MAALHAPAPSGRGRVGKVKRSAVKESFDNLPSGVCFFDANGIAILCNRQMHRLVFAIAGTDLQSLPDVRRIMDGEAPGARCDKGVFILDDGSAWRFSCTSVTGRGGSAYTQVVASDVTELYRRMNELAKDNLRLEEMGARMRRFSAGIIAATREEETLAMKMRVHDEIGRGIIATRRLLMQGGPVKDFDLTVWRNAIQMLRHSGDAPESGDSLAALAEAAAGIGIALRISGTPPDDPAAMALIIAAIRECTTNAARHAGATELYVRFSAEEDAATAVITNNGAPPRGAVAEGGGLSSLRAKIELNGGGMSVRAEPAFGLTVRVPLGREDMK